MSEDVNLDEIAERTDTYSGSDLHELCRCAAMNSFIEAIRLANREEPTDSNSSRLESNQIKQVFIRKVDFEIAFEKMAVKLMACGKNRFDFQNRLF